MPEIFSESWEYFVPDPEIAEAMGAHELTPPRDYKHRIVFPCATCGKPFAPRSRGGKYCSVQCVKRVGKRLLPEERVCKNCGRVFRPRRGRSVLCSRACTPQWAREVARRDRCKREP